MKTFKKVVATGAIFNGLATVAKSALNVGMKTEAITACLNMDTLKIFGTSFVTSTLPAVLVNAMDNLVIQNLTSNGLLQQGAIVAESVAFSHVTSIVADKNVLQFTKPDFTKLTNFDHFKVVDFSAGHSKPVYATGHENFLVDTANTFLQAEVMKYLDVFGGDEVLNPEFA